mmetsp:Transcript_17069/g.47956  ORF Transcript_17069/g.47956 Transcript_17069/m.47956 type:complete len:101 (-) Transcript_17069:424-726(-)
MTATCRLRLEPALMPATLAGSTLSAGMIATRQIALTANPSACPPMNNRAQVYASVVHRTNKGCTKIHRTTAAGSLERNCMVDDHGRKVAIECSNINMNDK